MNAEQAVSIMEEIVKKGSDIVKCEVVYEGEFYTVVQATTNIFKQDKTIPIVAEGVSRRSSCDKPDKLKGYVIAEGRALKALKIKLKQPGNDFYRIRKNGRKIKDLLKA